MRVDRGGGGGAVGQGTKLCAKYDDEKYQQAHAHNFFARFSHNNVKRCAAIGQACVGVCVCERVSNNFLLQSLPFRLKSHTFLSSSRGILWIQK